MDRNEEKNKRMVEKMQDYLCKIHAIWAAFDVQEKVKMERENLIFPLDEDIQVMNDKLDRMMISVQEGVYH